MKRVLTACVLALALTGAARAASITNSDAETAVVTIVEGENAMEVAIAPGGTETVCEAGCFITLPNGDRIGLAGGEAVEIVKGSAVVK
ncbi:hypothetical protein [Ensifer soli]|uniref:hypothetical protein n=1 Tax=Ciceribacter sp. sgz301302 TaxID=3342379 RepID=UPI0035BA6761